MDRQACGKAFETLARTYLQKNGLRFIAENYRCRWGEIDIVMRDKTSLVFVEVRYRGPSSFLSGAVSVDSRKQKKLTKTAMHYLAQHTRNDTPARFDVVSISQADGDQPKLDWIKNAFESC